jgi:hypothetical protein
MHRFQKIHAACLAAALLGGPASDAAEFYQDYTAGVSSTRAFSPESWWWASSTGGPLGESVVDSGGTGWNAWRLSDKHPALPNPSYNAPLGGRSAEQAARDGWRLSAYARFVDDFGSGPSMGLTAYLNNREYHLMFDLDAAQNLRATLYDEVPRSYTLTSNGDGTAAFHSFSLEGVPGSTAVDVYFQGERLTAEAPWDGRPFAHESLVQWGNSNRAGSSLGSMDFHYVVLKLGPFNELPGDFDWNGRVDGRDFIWWQRNLGAANQPTFDADRSGVVDSGDLPAWMAGFGAAAQDSGNGTVVPEPAGLVWLGGLAVALATRRMRGRR